MSGKTDFLSQICSILLETSSKKRAIHFYSEFKLIHQRYGI